MNHSMLMPREFDICLSNKCNLACRYCYFACKNRGRPQCLGFEQIKRALDIYLSQISPSKVEKISIGGGEPFLDYSLLLDTINLIRKRIGSKVEMEIFTNGTLLTKTNVTQLQEHNAKVIVSLDGEKTTNDLNRVSWKTPGISVFDAVTANLRKLPPECISKMCAGLTFTSKTAPKLPENIKFLTQLGFREILVDLDILEVWHKEKLDGLKDGLNGVKKLYAASIGNGFGSSCRPGFCLNFLLPENEIQELRNLFKFREISLAPDGCFYPTGLVSTHGPKKRRFRIGDLNSGIDFKKMKNLLDKVAAFFSAAQFKGYIACPVHIYFDCLLKGMSPAKIFTGGEQVYLCADEVIGSVIEFEHVNDFLASHPRFGDFEHRPKHVSAEEIGSLKLEMEDSPDISRARESVDFFLYSPGAQKQLVISWNGALCGFDMPESLAIYAIMKAGYLGKRLCVIMEGDCNNMQLRHLRFLSEHGILLRIRHGDESACNFGLILRTLGGRAVSAILPIKTRGMANNLEQFRRLAGLGVENILLEVDSGIRADRAMERVQAFFKEIGTFIFRRINIGKPVFLINLRDILIKSPGSYAVWTGNTNLRILETDALMNTGCKNVFRKIMALSASGAGCREYIRECVVRAKMFSRLFASETDRKHRMRIGNSGKFCGRKRFQ